MTEDRQDARQGPESLAALRAVTGVRARPSLKGIDRLPARDRAYAELKYRILEGRLPPDTKLLETEVAQLLGMSRTPVREALIKLEEEALITIRPRHGVTVRHQTLDDLAEIYAVFSCLEVMAAKCAAQRGLPREVIDRLKTLMAQMERATARGNLERWSRLDDDFHALIVQECGNRHLQGSLRQYWDQQYRARMAIVNLRPKPTRSDGEHRAIVAAIEARDVEEAARCHGIHRDHADKQLLSLLKGEATGAGQDDNQGRA